MSVTPFGFFFLPIVGFVLARRRSWLVALLIVSAVLHAPAVAVIAAGKDLPGIGITPWLAVAFAIFIHLFGLVHQRRRVELGPNLVVRGLLFGWTIFAIWSVLSAFVLPFVFEGMLTYNQENRDSLLAGVVPLRWRSINAVQAVNLAIAWMLLLYVLQVVREPGFARRLAIGFVVAGALALVLSVTQRLMILSSIPQHELIAASLNPSYLQHIVDYAPLGILRVGWPFSEPSYASVWFASLFAGGLGLALFSIHFRQGLVVAGLALIGALNSLGGSGLASVALCGLAICVVAIGAVSVAKAAQRIELAKRLFAVLTIGLLLGVTGMNLHRVERFSALTPQNLYGWMVLPRLLDHERVGPSRSQSNREAMRIVSETYGLGVGLGSNRASSYAMSMVSNLGVVPALLFFSLLAVQAWLLLQRAREHPLFIFMVCGQTGLLIGMIAGIPDLNWPAWWIWVIAGFGLVANQATGTQKTDRLVFTNALG